MALAPQDPRRRYLTPAQAQGNQLLQPQVLSNYGTFRAPAFGVDPDVVVPLPPAPVDTPPAAPPANPLPTIIPGEGGAGINPGPDGPDGPGGNPANGTNNPATDDPDFSTAVEDSHNRAEENPEVAAVIDGVLTALGLTPIGVVGTIGKAINSVQGRNQLTNPVIDKVLSMVGLGTPTAAQLGIDPSAVDASNAAPSGDPVSAEQAEQMFSDMQDPAAPVANNPNLSGVDLSGIGGPSGDASGVGVGSPGDPGGETGVGGNSGQAGADAVAGISGMSSDAGGDASGTGDGTGGTGGTAGPGGDSSGASGGPGSGSDSGGDGTGNYRMGGKVRGYRDGGTVNPLRGVASGETFGKGPIMHGSPWGPAVSPAHQTMLDDWDHQANLAEAFKQVPAAYDGMTNMGELALDPSVEGYDWMEAESDMAPPFDQYMERWAMTQPMAAAVEHGATEVNETGSVPAVQQGRLPFRSGGGPNYTGVSAPMGASPGGNYRDGGSPMMAPGAQAQPQGYQPGAGGPMGDDGDGAFEPVPATMHENEFVIRPEAASALGPQALTMLNGIGTQFDPIDVALSVMEAIMRGPQQPGGDFAAAGSPPPGMEQPQRTDGPMAAGPQAGVPAASQPPQRDLGGGDHMQGGPQDLSPEASPVPAFREGGNFAGIMSAIQPMAQQFMSGLQERNPQLAQRVNRFVNDVLPNMKTRAERQASMSNAPETPSPNGSQNAGNDSMAPMGRRRRENPLSSVVGAQNRRRVA